MKKLILGALIAALLAPVGYVAAQNVPVVLATHVSPLDAFAYAFGGIGGRSRFASPQSIAGVPGYSNAGTAVTAWTHTFGNSEVNFVMQPAGTLATGTLTTAPDPGDGQMECFFSTQTQTAITWTANTNQTMSGAPTAGVANTQQCMIYQASNATWVRAR